MTKQIINSVNKIKNLGNGVVLVVLVLEVVELVVVVVLLCCCVAGDVLRVEGELRATRVQLRPAFRPQAHVRPEVEGVQLPADVQKQAGLARRVAAAPPLPDEACRRETTRSRSRLLLLSGEVES